ncbi:hypothetical protein POPTR_008G152400v4 [Populus trichocarpa]|uniref:Uncharacterized protein n=1 Tax=Populus trichocarpa TaxID=3694 RepID=A0ACC0SLZ4_POPTR|nr:uncharacterized protein LOC112323273 [Populus trichocarpa]KAI5580185.1 hypothetical protein BDE02_08G138500 [Populus trichocarpa]KAI9390226.1 hypothetical protein POPTR_008G152400v4 [Populus trichocarpa]
MASTIKFSRPPILAFLLLLLMSFLYISLAAYCGSMGGSSGESSPVSSGGGSSFSPVGRGSSSWDYIDSGGSRGQGGGRRGSKVDVIIFVTGVVILVLFCAGFMIAFCCSEYQKDRKRKKSEQYRREPIKSEQYTLIMVQVGLMGKALSLQNELNEISSTANTSTARGWHRILTKTVSAFLRYPEYMISGFSSVEKYSTTGVVLMRFKQLSSEENEKCHAGSLVNFNNVNIQREGVPGKNYSKFICFKYFL